MSKEGTWPWLRLLESLEPVALIPLVTLGAEHKASKARSPYAGFLSSCQARQQHANNPSRAFYNYYHNKVLFYQQSPSTGHLVRLKKDNKKTKAFTSGTVSHVSLPILVIFFSVVPILLYFREMYLIIKQYIKSLYKKDSKCITSNQN